MVLREIVSTQPRKAFLREYKDRPVGADEVKVLVSFAAAKHGTEFTQFRNIGPFLNHRFDDKMQLFIKHNEEGNTPFFMAPGNMWVGEVTETGIEVVRIKIGDRIAGYGSFKSTHIIKESDALIMNETITWKQAVCFDPAHFALGGIKDSQMKLGDNVVIFGLGAIGLIAAQMAKLAGAAKVIVCDPIEKRRNVARINGSDLALNPLEGDIGLEIKRATDSRGADVIIETSGNYQALQQAIRGAAYNANIALVGWYHECTGGLDLGMEAHFNQPNILLSRACSEPLREYPRWDFARIKQTCWTLMLSDKIYCENIVDPVVPIDSAAQAYMDIETNPDCSIKLGVAF
jgi:2-desacetyl-2-hydroxyethyl bacteriochlorophyllide A dehydrogenase